MRHQVILAVALSFGTGCSKDAPPAPPTRDNPFPVRVLPSSPGEDPDLMLKETFEGGADDWWVFGMRDERLVLEKVADSPLAHVEDGALVLPKGQATLVRFVELPPGRQHDVNAVLRADDAAIGDLTDLLHFCVLQELEDGDDMAEIVRSQTIHDRNRSLSLLVALPVKFRFQRQRPQARWQSTPDLGGYARARHRIIGTNTRRAYAIFLPATDREVRLRSFDIRKVGQFQSKTTVSKSKDGATSVKLSGDVLPSVWMDPGDSLDLPASLPAGANRLSFSVGPDPDATADQEARFTATLQGANGDAIAQWTRKITRGAGAPTFLPVSVDFQTQTTEDIAATLRMEIDGDMGLFVGHPLVRGKARDARKNLLFISLDTLRADHLGSAGYDRNTSPFLDELAHRSARFTNYFAVAPYTLPTHATMLTGRLPLRHGVISDIDRLDTREVPYLPRILGDYGYVTAAFTGGGFLSEVYGFPVGFDQFRTEDPIEPRALEDDARDTRGGDALAESQGMSDVVSWIAEHRDERWFLFLHTFTIHDYKPPAADLALFDTHPTTTEGLDHFKYIRDREWVDKAPLEGDIQYYVDRYDATIHYTDRVLAAFWKELERAGVLEDTVVVITADHGEEFWDHGSLKHSVTLYDEMLHVPLWIHVPGVHPSESGHPPLVINEPTSQADLMPTLLELLGIDEALDLDGQSLASFVRGTPIPRTTYTPLVAAVETRLSSRASLRVGRYKIIENNRSSHVRLVAPTEAELYDRVSDPGETRDLAETDPGRLEKMLEQMKAVEAVLRLGAVTADHAEMTPELMAQLKELGYF